MKLVYCNNENMGYFLNVETRPSDGLVLVWFADKNGKINSVPKDDVIIRIKI
jgi:hypothetical protein